MSSFLNDAADSVHPLGTSIFVEAPKAPDIPFVASQSGRRETVSSEDELTPVSSTTTGSLTTPAGVPDYDALGGNITVHKHERFYMLEKFFTAIIQVSNDKAIAYRLPTYFFTRDSSWFSDHLQPHPDGTLPAVTLDDVDPHEFDAFLCILFPRDFQDGDLTKEAEWIAALKLATRWFFQSIRNLAIAKLDKSISPINRLVIARKYCVRVWTDPALEALCTRPEPLSLPEIRRMHDVDIALITYIQRTAPRPENLRDAILNWRRAELASVCIDPSDKKALTMDLTYYYSLYVIPEVSRREFGSEAEASPRINKPGTGFTSTEGTLRAVDSSKDIGSGSLEHRIGSDIARKAASPTRNEEPSEATAPAGWGTRGNNPAPTLSWAKRR